MTFDARKASAALFLGALSTGLGYLVPEFAASLESLNQRVVLAYCLMGAILVIATLALSRGLRRDMFALTNVVYGSLLLLFVVRPYYLLEHVDVLGAYDPYKHGLSAVGAFRAQEIVLYFATLYPGSEPLDAINGALTLGLAFTCAFAAGHLVGSRRKRRIAYEARAEASSRSVLNLMPYVGVLLIVSLFAQVLILKRAGGVHASLSQLSTQHTLNVSFKLFALETAGTAALILWLAFNAPLSRVAWFVFGGALAEQVVFAAIAGSRTRAVFPLLGAAVVYHHRVKRLPLGRLLIGTFALVVVLSTFLVFRQATYDRSVGAAAAAAIASGPDIGTMTRDLSQFDALVEMVGSRPDGVPAQHGRRVLAGVATLLPRVLTPGTKPEGSDIWFRKAIWGTRFAAGRPYTIVGDLWADFGLVGVIAGGVLLGLFLGSARHRRADAAWPSAFHSCAVLVVWSFVTGAYSIGFVAAMSLFPVVAAAGLFLNPREPMALSSPTSVRR